MSMVVDRRELDFVLFELLDIERLQSHPKYASYDRDAMRQMLDTAQGIAETEFLPIAAKVDADEPRFADGDVVLPAGIGQALGAYAQAGFFALPFKAEIGGLQAPWVLHTAASGMFSCANTAVTNYAFLTIAAANLLSAFGSEELKARFLPRCSKGDGSARCAFRSRRPARRLATSAPPLSLATTVYIASAAAKCGSRVASTRSRKT